MFWTGVALAAAPFKDEIILESDKISRCRTFNPSDAVRRYAVMLDGDHTIEEAWRLRLAAFRLYQECRHRSIEYCNHAFNLLKTFDGHAHIWTRMFPTPGAAPYPM